MLLFGLQLPEFSASRVAFPASSMAAWLQLSQKAFFKVRKEGSVFMDLGMFILTQVVILGLFLTACHCPTGWGEGLDCSPWCSGLALAP